MLDTAQLLSAALELRATFEARDSSALYDPISTLQHPQDSPAQSPRAPVGSRHQSRQSLLPKEAFQESAAGDMSGHAESLMGTTNRRVHFATAWAGPAQAGSAQAGSAQAGSAHAGSAQAGSAQAGSVHVDSVQAAPPIAKQSLRSVASLDLSLVESGQPALVHSGLACVMFEKSSGRIKLISYSEAFTLIAEGTKCIVTGTAFEHLLQHAEPALVEAVLQSMVVAARMRSHQ